jgi:hypothetical protein
MKKIAICLAVISLLLNSSVLYSQSHPSDATVCAGGTATFTIDFFTGNNYQWQADHSGNFIDIPNGGAFSGANTNTLTISGCVTNMDNASFRCEVTSRFGKVYTNPAKLYVRGITSQPSTQTICSGTSRVFSVNATTTSGSPTYTWQYSTNNSNWYTISSGGSGSPGYSNYTTRNLTVSNPPSTYYFRCRVAYTSPSCSQYSNTAVFYNDYPMINSSPADRNVCYGGSTTLSVTTSEPGLTYQWQRVYYQEGIPPIPGMWVDLDISNGGGSPGYSGATTPTLTVSNITFDYSGDSYYRCRVTNCNGYSFSGGATTTVVYSPNITSHPANRKICAGTGTSFSVNASGYNLSYR